MTTSSSIKNLSGSRKKTGVSLKLSVFLVTLAAAIVPLGIFSYLNYQTTKELVTRNAQDSIIKSNLSSAKLVKTWLDSNAVAVRALATTADFVAMEPNRARANLTAVNNQTPVFYTVTVTDLLGQQIARSGDARLVNVADLYYYKRILAGDEAVVQSGISKTNGKAFIAFASPIKKDGTLTGILAALALAEPITDQVTGGKIGMTGISYMVDSVNKTILAHPDIKLVGQGMDAADLAKTKPENFGKIYDGLNAAKIPVKIVSNSVGSGLVLISEIYASEVEAPIIAAQKSSLTFIALALVMSSLLSFLLARTISNGISKLAFIVTSVSRAGSPAEISRLERQVEVVGGSSELRRIAAAILRLTASIKVAMRSM